MQRAILSREIIYLEEILGYCNESAYSVSVPPEPPEQAGRALYERLRISVFKEQICFRVKDLKKNMSGCRHNLEVLGEMANIVSEAKMFTLQDNVGVNTDTLCKLQHSQRELANSFMVMQAVLGGILAFEIMDRITGKWTVVNTTWMQPIVSTLMDLGPYWTLLNLLLWFVLARFILSKARKMSYNNQGLISLRIKVNARIDMDALRIMMEDQDVINDERKYTINNSVCRATWKERNPKDWGGAAPTISIVYDEATSFLLFMTVKYRRRTANKKLAFNAAELRVALRDRLKNSGVLLEED